jgi:hypothetical protein
VRVVYWIGPLALMASVLLFGCGGGGGSSSGPSNPTVRYINSVPDSTALNFRINEQPAATKIPYLGSSPSFTAVSPNTYDFDVTENGQTVSLDAVALALAAGADYAVIALGEENFGTEFAKRARLLVQPVNRAAPNGTKARLIVVNAFNEATGVPTPSIDFTNPGNNPTFSLTGIVPGTGQELDIDAGSQEFIARQTGSQGSYVDQTFNFASGGVYVMLVTGINGDNGAEAPAIDQIQLQTR